MGMWVNATAKGDYKLTEGTDYSYFQFPALGMGHDDTSVVDTKEVNVTANGANLAAFVLLIAVLVISLPAIIQRTAGAK